MPAKPKVVGQEVGHTQHPSPKVSREVRDQQSHRLLGWLVVDGGLRYQGKALVLQVPKGPSPQSFEDYTELSLGWGEIYHGATRAIADQQMFLTADPATAKALRKHPGFYRLED